MKNNILIIMAISIVFVITSCNKIENYSSNNNTNITSKTTKQSVQKSPTKTNLNAQIAKNKSYEIIQASYVDKNIKINYPQITNLCDFSTQKLINELIKNDIIKVWNNYPDDKNKWALQINYNIKLESANLLSIMYTGDDSIEGFPRVNHSCYTENININNGSKIRLKDIVNIDESFISKLLDGKFKALIPEQNSELKNGLTIDTWMKHIKEADSIENVGTENQSETYSYLTEDSLGISVGVSHAAGDHGEFEIKYQDIKDNIKTDNEIWKDLLN